MEHTAILGLSLNTRMLGLAVIAGNDLIDYRIQLRKDPYTPRKRELILTSLQPWCERYNIINIALSIPYENQTSRETQELLESLKNHFREKKIRLHAYAAKTLYTFCSEARAKKEVMKALAVKYPLLLPLYRKEMSNKNKYYVKLFEAVGVATIHAERLK